MVLHSSDPIAPVGFLHPLTFHLEKKEACSSLSMKVKGENSCEEKAGYVFEVQGELTERCDVTCQSAAEVTGELKVTNQKIMISRTKKENTFSICCWLQDPSETSAGIITN